MRQMIDLSISRQQIDEIDSQIVELFEKRMKVAGGFWPVTFFTLLLGAEPDILYIIVNDISFLSGFYKSKGDVRIWQER